MLDTLSCSDRPGVVKCMTPPLTLWWVVGFVSDEIRGAAPHSMELSSTDGHTRKKEINVGGVARLFECSASLIYCCIDMRFPSSLSASRGVFSGYNTWCTLMSYYDVPGGLISYL